MFNGETQLASRSWAMAHMRFGLQEKRREAAYRRGSKTPPFITALRPNCPPERCFPPVEGGQTDNPLRLVPQSSPHLSQLVPGFPSQDGGESGVGNKGPKVRSDHPSIIHSMCQSTVQRKDSAGYFRARSWGRQHRGNDPLSSR